MSSSVSIDFIYLFQTFWIGLGLGTLVLNSASLKYYLRLSLPADLSLQGVALMAQSIMLAMAGFTWHMIALQGLARMMIVRLTSEQVRDKQNVFIAGTTIIKSLFSF